MIISFNDPKPDWYSIAFLTEDEYEEWDPDGEIETGCQCGGRTLIWCQYPADEGLDYPRLKDLDDLYECVDCRSVTTYRDMQSEGMLRLMRILEA